LGEGTFHYKEFLFSPQEWFNRYCCLNIH
jgi:hypothetical protein